MISYDIKRAMFVLTGVVKSEKSNYCENPRNRILTTSSLKWAVC